MTDPCLLPSAYHDGIGTPDCIAFAASLIPPYQRFAYCLTAVTRAHCNGLSPGQSLQNGTRPPGPGGSFWAS